MRKAPPKKLPLVLVHVVITTGPEALRLSEPLRDAIRDLIRDHASQCGVRIKRRRVTTERLHDLWVQYEKREKLHTLVE